MAKNKIMERIQKYDGETPENGVNYNESCIRIGGADNAPIFEAKLDYDGNSLSLRGSYGETKKSLLRRLYKEFCEKYNY
jgi:hypothetical protein